MGVKPAKEGREWLDRQGRQDDGLGTFTHCRHGSLLHSTAHSIYRQWKELAALERPSVNHLLAAAISRRGAAHPARSSMASGGATSTMPETEVAIQQMDRGEAGVLASTY